MTGEKPAGIKHDYSSPRWTGELNDCSMPMTFDTYSNCSFGCVYCFSQYQRGIGLPADAYKAKNVRSVNVDRVKGLFTGKKPSQFSNYINERITMQWGGLSDQFDGFERKHGVTLELLRFFKEIDYPLSFSTKSTWWLDDPRYTELFKGQRNWNCKFSIITLDEEDARRIEVGVPSPQARLDAIEKFSNLDAGGATLRLRPFILGVTSKNYLELIRQASEHGATAMSTEFFCLERRSINSAAENYRVISECAGRDIVDFYAKNSFGTGYLRLNRKVKEPYIRRMRELAHSLGMRFYVSDAHFKEASDNCCCCGLPDDWKVARFQFSEALQLCKRNGRVTYSEVKGDADHFDFEWSKASGYNRSSQERLAKFEGMSMADYMHYLWNTPKAGQSPYMIFEGVMRPDGYDEHGDIVYVYDQSRTFIPQGEDGSDG